MARRHYRTCLGLNGFGWAHVIYGMPYNFNKILSHAQSLGFDGIEMFGMPTPYPQKKPEQKALRKRVEDHGLRIASIQSLPGGLGNGHPGSSYSCCRDDYVEYIKEMLELANTLGCDHIGAWGGEIFGTGPNRLCQNYMVETYSRCAEAAKAARMPICLEAEPVQQVNTPQVWFKILKGANSKYLKGICDFAHLNIISNKQPMRLLKRLLPYIGHTHLCDNDGARSKVESRSSKHLPLGKGSMDWQRILKTLLDNGYKQWLDIDVWEHPDPFGASTAGKQALDKFLDTY